MKLLLEVAGGAAFVAAGFLYDPVAGLVVTGAVLWVIAEVRDYRAQKVAEHDDAG